MSNHGYDKVPTSKHSSLHREQPGLLSLLFFGWMSEVFKTGNTRPLQQCDFLPLDEENKARALSEKLQTIWDNERKASFDCGKTPKLWKSVVKMVPAKEIPIVMLFGLVNAICYILSPLLLGLIISGLISQNSDKSLMYVYALLVGVVTLGKTYSLHLKSFLIEMFGVKLTCALKGVIFSKVTLVSQQTLQEFQQGHVIDLLSNDVQRIELAPKWFIEVTQSLIFVLPTVIYLFLNLFHWTALAGVLFFIALVPCFVSVSFIAGKLRRQTALVSDQRISVMNELVSGIRAVKTHAWENNYRDIVKDIRRKEIGIILEKTALMSIVEGLITTSASIATFLSVLSFVLADEHLTPANAFMLLSFMNVLRVSVSMILGRGLLVTFEAFVSLKRIEEFLLLDNLPSSILATPFFKGLSRDQRSHDLPEMRTSRRLNGEADEHQQLIQCESETNDWEQVLLSKETSDALVVSKLAYKLGEPDSKYILRDVSFVTRKNSITVITGQVGSGKSTLLSSIAGEVQLLSGTVSCPGSLAYVPQVPWVFSGTIRENILFGELYDHDWYAEVIGACALKEDIERFPDRNETIVGERGVVLSGGQKARVSLARAVYSSSDVYLLDDPLSAVDQKVGEHIFDKCICGLLSDKLRVVVSHHQRYLKAANQVVILDNGCILVKGTFLELEMSADTKGIFSRIFVGDGQFGQLDAEKSSLLERNHFQQEAVEPRRHRSTDDEPKGLEISDEDRFIGKVSFQLYWEYFTSACHPVLIIALMVLFGLCQAIMVTPDVWLSHLTKESLEQQQKYSNLVIYACLATGSFFVSLIRVFLFYRASLKSSECIHDNMVAATLHAQVSFFDTNPTGRILNRFSKDIGSMDEQLPLSFLISIEYLLFAFTAVLISAITNVWMLFVIVPTLVLFVLFSRYYLKTSRELKRLESICRSPVFAHFSETMTGLDTIRTRGMEQDFINQFYRHQDSHNQVFYMVIASARWFGLRVDLLCTPFVTCVALAAVLVSLDAALVGLSLAYVIETVEYTQYAVRQCSEVENLMTSVERVMTYSNLESEPGYKINTLPPTHWPRDGHVAFKNVSLTYYEGGPRVLQNLNFNVKEKSKIGIVGRTGAGKSSLVAALLRMPDAEGDIIIDGVRINDINLQESRRSISVLSQVPVLFSGSMRRNLDPTKQHKDVQLWAALEEVQLKSLVENLNGQLEYELLERGTNLSVGERQLICLARTLLQHNKVIILDEPTAHVDPITERTIWDTVHEKLKDCTVITIAHRLNTIRDCDMILVLRDGEVVEYDVFDSLMGREGSVLASMQQQAQE